MNELLSPTSEEGWRVILESYLLGRGFPVTDWHSGSVEKTNLYIVARALSTLDAKTIPAIAASGFLDLAAGEWLDFTAYSQYDELRKPSTFTTLRAYLTAQPGRGPYDLRPGDIRAQTESGLKFQSVTGGVLQPGTALAVDMLAESPGAAYNAPAGTLNQLLTPLPGVSILNDGTFIATGRDAETDEELRQRCKLKWASIGYGANSAAYEYWALTASPAVSQVRILDQHPRGPGTVDVVIWGQGGLSDADVATVDAFVQARRSNTANVFVYRATPRVVPLVGPVFVKSADLITAREQAIANITRLQREIGIGQVVYRSAVDEMLMTPAGVRNADLTSPAANIPLGTTEAVIFDTAGLDWIQV